MLLTVDLGTSATKVALWDGDRIVALASEALATAHPGPGLAEQRADDWLTSIGAATRAVRAQTEVSGPIDRLSFSAARESFVPVDASGRTLGSAILWSDRRGAAFVREVIDRLGGDDRALETTGQRIDAGTMAAKVGWLERREPDRFAAARWLLAPRDFVIHALTGEVVTDPTLAIRTGLYDLELRPLADDGVVRRLPRIVPSDTVVGVISREAAEQLGLPAGVEVVVGAGDRACEVLGTGAAETTPMTSWGTTANTSVPTRGSGLVPGWSLSVGALGGWIREAGLSAAGQAIDWLAGLTGHTPDALRHLASASPPGSNGVTAAPFLNGARAPWWLDGVAGAFAGLTSSTTAGDLARAVVEAVATDIALAHTELPEAPLATVVAGGGAHDPLWREVLAASLGVPVIVRAHAHAASVGARMLAAPRGDIDALNPVVDVVEPDPALVPLYKTVLARRKQLVAALS